MMGFFFFDSKFEISAKHNKKIEAALQRGSAIHWDETQNYL
jgi:hypothetical protein